MRTCPNCTEALTERGWCCDRCGNTPARDRGVWRLHEDEAVHDAGFDPAVFEMLAAREAEHFWHRSRAGLLAWAFGRNFPEAKRFLEVGCGTGLVISTFAEKFPGLEVTGCDAFLEGLVHASGRLGERGELLRVAAGSLPFREEFDVIGAFDVLEHIQDDLGALEQMREALAPGGGLILTVPQHPSLWSQADQAAHHVRRYTARGLLQTVRQAGFSVTMTTSFVSLLLPLMALARIRPGKKSNEEFLRQEMSLPSWINRVLYGVLSLERGIIGAGLRLPAGGSRLVIARKN